MIQPVLGKPPSLFIAMVVLFVRLPSPTNPHIFSLAIVPTGVVIVLSHAHILLQILSKANREVWGLQVYEHLRLLDRTCMWPLVAIQLCELILCHH